MSSYYTARTIAGLFKRNNQGRRSVTDDVTLKIDQYVAVWSTLVQAHTDLINYSTKLALTYFIDGENDLAEFYANKSREYIGYAEETLVELVPKLIDKMRELNVDKEFIEDTEDTLNALEEQIRVDESSLDLI